MPNKLKELWQQGKTTLNGWVLMPSGLSAEVMSRAGFDSVLIDMQHGMHDYASMVECLRAMSPTPVVPLVRPPANEPAMIGKALDAGAYGLVCPMTNTPDHVRDFISFCKYPPAGERSNGPVRVGLYAPVPGAYQKTANDEVLCIPMIETREALENLEEIIKVPGIDALYVGPTDLGASLGVGPKMDHEEAQMLQAYERILSIAGRHRIPVGMHCGTPQYAKRMGAMGFKMLTLGWDTLHLSNSLKAAVAALRA